MAPQPPTSSKYPLHICLGGAPNFQNPLNRINAKLGAQVSDFKFLAKLSLIRNRSLFKNFISAALLLIGSFLGEKNQLKSE